MKEPRIVETLSPAGSVIARFVGFGRLKAGDHFHILDEDDQPGPTWIALSDPYQVTRGRKQLAIQAKQCHEAREMQHT